MSKTKSNPEFTTIILTSIITAMLTLLASYFIMSKQLSKEHNYWISRTKTERNIQLMEKRISLIQKLNNNILSIELLAKTSKLYAAKFQSDILLNKNVNDELEILNTKNIKYHNEINKLIGNLQLSEIYFSSEVDVLINPLIVSIEKNSSHNQIFRDTINKNDINELIKYFQRDFSSIPELTNKKMEFIKAMRDDIDKSIIEVNKHLND